MKQKGRPRKAVLERLYEKTLIPKNKDGSNSKTKCWVWNGSVNNVGYGLIHVNKEVHMATVHRVVMIEECKKITYKDKIEVLHECGNKLCVNPHHLKLGTMADRHDLQRKYKAYNRNFHNRHYMWRTCEHCGGIDYLPHFKRKHSLCNHLAQHKYITESLSGKI